MDRLSGMLLDMGITPDLKGFECIKIGVSMLVAKKNGIYINDERIISGYRQNHRHDGIEGGTLHSICSKESNRPGSRRNISNDRRFPIYDKPVECSILALYRI